MEIAEVQLTGLEVIRARPRALLAGGDYQLQALPGEKVELTYGDWLRVNVGLEYKGPGGDATLYGAIGVRGATFNEKVAGETEPGEVSFPRTENFSPWTGSVNIPITADIKPGTNYDLYCKIKEYPGAGMPEVSKVIDIVGIPPSYEMLEETVYPLAYIYDGPYEGGTITFKSDPFTPASWIAGRLAAKAEEEIRKAGGKMLEMRIYADKSPLLWTDWRVEVASVPPKTTAGAVGSPGLPLWAVIVLAVLAIALIIVITWAAKEIAGLFKRKPYLEDVKVGWGKETLILAIQDSEEYWERTPTPPEELEAMSEGDLRHLLNKIAEEEVVTGGLGWLWIAGIVGAGAIVAGLALSKPKKTAKHP